jgi:hypothetical protein
MTTPTRGEPQDPIRVYLRIGATEETCIGEIVPEIRMTEVNGNHAAVTRSPSPNSCERWLTTSRR